MSGDSIPAVSTAQTCTQVHSTNTTTDAQTPKGKYDGVNKPALIGLYGVGAGFCAWQGVDFLKSKVNLGKVKSSAWHNLNMNIPFKFLRTESYIQANRTSLAELENLATSLNNPSYKKHAQNIQNAINEYNQSLRANSTAQAQWFKSARHTYAKQALQGAKFRTGMSRGVGGLLLAASALFAAKAIDIATNKA